MAKEVNRRVAQPPALPRRDWVRGLHRPAVRWDVLFHELALALLRRYWHTQASFGSDTFRLENQQLPTVALFLSLALRRRVSMNAVSELAGRPRQPSLWEQSADELEALLHQAQLDFRQVLCSYCEVTGEAWIRRDHRDLTTLLARLRETLRQFITVRCRPGGDLRACLEEPLGDDEGYFPLAASASKPQASGDARRDAYQLENLALDGDDAQTLKSKLMDFVRADPLLAPEQSHFIAERRKAQGDKKMTAQEEFDFTYSLTSDFIFNPTRQGGRTPISLFLDTQLFLSEQQRQRLERWERETVMGLFRIVACSEERVELEDMVVGGRYCVTGSQGGSIKPFATDSVLLARLVPWDKEWRFTGVQRVMGIEPRQLPQLLASLSPMNYRRPSDNGDARVRHAAELSRLAQGQWLKLFGQEAVASRTLEQHRAKIAQWYALLREEKCAADGRTLAEAAAAEVGLALPAELPQLQAEEGTFHDLTLLFDGDRGLAEVADYAWVREAMAAEGELSAEARSAVFMYLSAPWIPAWCCDKLLRPFGPRLERVVRELLGEASFSLERDWDGLMGHFRPLDHRLPVRPKLWL